LSLACGGEPFATTDDTTRHDTTRHDTTRHDTTRHDTTHGPLPQEKQDRQIIGVCINVASLALAVVMAGTGDLDTLRILRRLHRRISPQVRTTYSSSDLEVHVMVALKQHARTPPHTPR
jgi:hypothetical protein